MLAQCFGDSKRDLVANTLLHESDNRVGLQLHIRFHEIEGLPPDVQKSRTLSDIVQKTRSERNGPEQVFKDLGASS